MNNSGGVSTEATTEEPPKRMLQVNKRDGKWFIEINSSSLDVIQTCPKKSQYALHRGLVSKEPGLAVTFGKAVHRALELMYMTPRDERKLPPQYKKDILLMCQGQTLDNEQSSFVYRATRGFLDEAAPLANLPMDDKRSLVNGGYLLGEYFETRAQDPYEVIVKDGKPLVETLYDKEIYDDKEMNIKIFGTIDAIMENKATGQIVVCDHKTTSATNMNDFYNRTKPNHQYTMYTHLVRECLGYPTENFMINIFQVKPRPKTSRGKGPDFMHIITKRTPQDIEDCIKSIKYFVSQYIYWLETDYFPFGTPNACANYGRCQYLDICQSPEAIKESIIEANFKERGYA